MFEILRLADQNTFFFLNRDISNPLLNVIMPFITNLNNWRIPILIIWILLMIKGGRKGRVAAILLVPILVMCDQISASLIKPWVARIRPCHELLNVTLLVGCGGKYSFPSSHATNISGFGMLFSFIYPRYWIGFAVLTILIGLSRSYVGVHYPGDVLSGFILGAIIALVVFYVYQILAQKYPNIKFDQ